MHGEGIHLPNQAEGSAPIVGFYTTRIARAATEQEAKALAIAQVQSEWAEGGAYAKANIGASPSLSIEAISRSGILEAWLFRDTGHTFYPAEDQNA